MRKTIYNLEISETRFDRYVFRDSFTEPNNPTQQYLHTLYHKGFRHISFKRKTIDINF